MALEHKMICIYLGPRGGVYILDELFENASYSGVYCSDGMLFICS